MLNLLSQSTVLEGKFGYNNRFNIFSKSKTPRGLSMIDKHHFYIQGMIKQKNKNVSLSYKVRGNSSYSILPVAIFLGFLPFIIMIQLKIDHNTPIILSPVIALGFIIIIWSSLKYRSQVRLGKKYFQQFIEDLKS